MRVVPASSALCCCKDTAAEDVNLFSLQCKLFFPDTSKREADSEVDDGEKAGKGGGRRGEKRYT